MFRDEQQQLARLRTLLAAWPVVTRTVEESAHRDGGMRTRAHRRITTERTSVRQSLERAYEVFAALVDFRLKWLERRVGRP